MNSPCNLSALPPSTRLRSSAPSRRLSSLPVLCWALLLLQGPWAAHGRIYINNDTYASLPGLFGQILAEDRTYQGRVQFLRENPYLCDDPITINGTSTSSFVKPTGPIIRDSNGGTITLIEPIVLLASRGECPFQRKAQVAQAIDPSIEYLIVFNFNLDSEDTLVPMYSEFGDTRLFLLSATHRGGQAIKRYIESQPPEVLATGGPMVLFDAIPPEGLISVDDLRNMLLSALGLFFMLISVSGCVMILVGSYGGQFPPGLDGGGGSAMMVGGNGAFDPTGSGATTGGGGGRSTSRSNRAGLLTMEQVQKLSEWGDPDGSAVAGDMGAGLPPTAHSETASLTALSPEASSSSSRLADDDAAASAPSSAAGGLEGNDPYNNNSDGNDGGDGSNNNPCCAVCIDEIDQGSDATQLPCGHHFHTPCIAPWLTERQAKCPLCKYDVLEYVLQKEREDLELKRSMEVVGTDPSPTRRLWDRLRNALTHPGQESVAAYASLELGGRRHGPQHHHHHHHHRGTMISPEEMMVELSGSVATSTARLEPDNRRTDPPLAATRAPR